MYTLRTNLVPCTLLALLLVQVILVESDSFHEEIGLSTAELVRLRHFIAEEHLVITIDGYILNLVRVLNPFFNNGTKGLDHKRPVLFIHGESGVASLYLVESLNARPKDLTGLFDVASANLEDLIEALKDEPVAGSLPLLASCFGHEVWLFNRRSTVGSLGHISPTMQPFKDHKKPEDAKPVGQDSRVHVTCCASGRPGASSEGDCLDPVSDLSLILQDYEDEVVNPRYWNFTLDAHALIDLPRVIDYILARTRQAKLDIVGHSTGSAISMMMLTRMAHRANQVERLINLGPSIYQSNSTAPLKLKQYAARHALAKYTGPLSLPNSSPQVNCLLTEACYQVFPRAMCDSDKSPAQGQVGNNELSMAAYSSMSGKPVSSKQTLQIVQDRERGRMYAYNYGNPYANALHYGTFDPPLYDVSNLKNNGVTMSFFRGFVDSITTPTDIERLVRDMGFRPTDYYYNEWSIFFNHQAPICHQLLRKLVNIPALKEIEAPTTTT